MIGLEVFNVWGWAEDRLRKIECKRDAFTVFKRRVAAVSKQYPSSGKLVPSLSGRIAKCIARKGANIGK